MTLLIFDVRLAAPVAHSLGHDLWFRTWPNAFYGLSLAAATFMLAVLWHAARRHGASSSPGSERRGAAPDPPVLPDSRVVRRRRGAGPDRPPPGLALFRVVGCGYLLHIGTRVAPTEPHRAPPVTGDDP